MEGQYAEEARIAARSGEYRIAADKYVQAVRAATNKLSDNRIVYFMAYFSCFIRKSEAQLDNGHYGYLPPENKDVTTLISFLDNPHEHTILRANAAMALGTIYHLPELGRRDIELAAIYCRRGIQECFKASIEERNHIDERGNIRHGEIFDRLRDSMTERLASFEFPANAFASQIASLPYPAIATSYGIYDSGP